MSEQKDTLVVEGATLTLTPKGMTKADLVVELRKRLAEGVAVFGYTKKDGTLRRATGTLLEAYWGHNPREKAYEDLLKRVQNRLTWFVGKVKDRLPIQHRDEVLGEVTSLSSELSMKLVENEEKPYMRPTDESITYFDLEAHAWRNCKTENLVFIL